MRVILADPACYQGNAMIRLKSLTDGLRRQVAARVQQERSQRRRSRRGTLAATGRAA